MVQSPTLNPASILIMTEKLGKVTKSGI